MMSVKCAFSRISHRGTSIDVSEQVQSIFTTVSPSMMWSDRFHMEEVVVKENCIL